MTKQNITPADLKELLYAVCNIGGNASPETTEGITYSEAALAMVSPLFISEDAIRRQMIESGYGRTPEQIEEFDPYNAALDPEIIKAGQIKTVELWLECMKAENPSEHLREEVQKGLSGTRIE